MKVLKLQIEKFRHLENVDFDFTYPKDFYIKEKRGMPLDKICFIGQSATGKTNLLELIFDTYSYLFDVETISNKYLLHRTDGGFKSFNGEFVSRFKNEYLTYNKSNISFRGIEFNSSNPTSGSIDQLIPPTYRNGLFYLKSNLISDKNIELFSSNPIDLIEKYNSQIENIKISARNNRIRRHSELIFDDKVDESTWLFLITEILDYRKNFTQKMSELIHKGLLANQNKLSEEFNKWQKDNPNTLEMFAKKFNPALEKLNLEVDIINTEYSIPIKNKRNDEIIPIQSTSTGTKGLLLSFLPLYKLDTKYSIILIDEPERSLYPDMQMDLMQYYQNLAPDAQFIVATHSPFIAASFEPEERFILYFDEEGKVSVRRGSSPIGDDPNDMLKNDFGINYYNKYGEEAYKKYLKLKEDLEKEKDPTKKKEILLETVKLGDTYNF